MTQIPDQKPVWDKKHAAGDHDGLRHQTSPLARLAEPYLAEHSYILELGCGVGRDAEFFSTQAHTVIATDGSKVVIEQNRKQLADTGIKFDILDMLDNLPYPEGTFDVVFANLSLHYYSDADTKRIIGNIKKVLKPDGLLIFACKSLEDFHHGKGKEVEKDIFVSDSGHVRHLFSEAYTNTLLDGLFDIKHLDVVDEVYNGQASSILRCIAKNIKNS